MKFGYQFASRFRREEVDRLVRKYLANKEERDREERAFAAGRRIVFGQYGHGDLMLIHEWKTRGRGKHRLDKNSDEEISDALRLAVSARTERAAVSVLKGLHGVEVPVASAILTAIDQERYTVIDFRALESLGVRIRLPGIDAYLQYLAYCRGKAHEWDVRLRDLDRALWQWSFEQAIKGRKIAG